MNLTPQILQSSYKLLIKTHPFNRWKLPEISLIKFRINKSTTEFGSYTYYTDNTHLIILSSEKIGRFETLLPTLAHEIVHMRLRTIGKGNALHGKQFQKLAALVCKHHGWDIKGF